MSASGVTWSNRPVRTQDLFCRVPILCTSVMLVLCASCQINDFPIHDPGLPVGADRGLRVRAAFSRSQSEDRGDEFDYRVVVEFDGRPVPWASVTLDGQDLDFDPRQTASVGSVPLPLGTCVSVRVGYQQYSVDLSGSVTGYPSIEVKRTDGSHDVDTLTVHWECVADAGAYIVNYIQGDRVRYSERFFTDTGPAVIRLKHRRAGVVRVAAVGCVPCESGITPFVDSGHGLQITSSAEVPVR